MPLLAFCANCGSDRLQIGAATSTGIEITCYTCTAKIVLTGIILGEVDFLAGAKSKVEAMITAARERAQRATKRPTIGSRTVR